MNVQPITIDGKERRLRLNMKAGKAIHKLTGKNVMAGENWMADAEDTFDRVITVLRILLQWEDPEITDDYLMDVVDFADLPRIGEAIGKLMNVSMVDESAPPPDPPAPSPAAAE